MVWTALTALGAILSGKLAEREAMLEVLTVFLCRIRLEVAHSERSLPEIIKQLSEEKGLSGLKFLKPCTELLNSNVDFPVAWRSCIERTLKSIETAQREMLCELGCVLCTCDKEGVFELLSLYEERFGEFFARAKAERKKYSRLCLLSGVFVGGIFFILSV